jgi:hypothetical protein
MSLARGFLSEAKKSPKLKESRVLSGSINSLVNSVSRRFSLGEPERRLGCNFEHRSEASRGGAADLCRAVGPTNQK